MSRSMGLKVGAWRSIKDNESDKQKAESDLVEEHNEIPQGSYSSRKEDQSMKVDETEEQSKDVACCDVQLCVEDETDLIGDKSLQQNDASTDKNLDEDVTSTSTKGLPLNSVVKDKGNELPKTRVGLEEEIERMEQAMMKAGHARKFTLAREREKELNELIEFRDYLPSAKELKGKLETLNSSITSLINERKWDEAESVQHIIEGVQKQLSIEQKAEETKSAFPVAMNMSSRQIMADDQFLRQIACETESNCSSSLAFDTDMRLESFDMESEPSLDAPQIGAKDVGGSRYRKPKSLSFDEKMGLEPTFAHDVNPLINENTERKLPQLKPSHRRAKSLNLETLREQPDDDFGVTQLTFAKPPLDHARPPPKRCPSSPALTRPMSTSSDPYEERRHRKRRSWSHSGAILNTKEDDLFDCLTVFQAEPLVWFDDSNCYRFPSPPDLEYEKETLLEALKDAQKVGGKIDVTFETATTNRLAALLATEESQVVHFSGHGDPEYLAIEDEWGGMQALLVDELKQLMETGRGHLKFVFVSACYSRRAGEAFIEAGVPHVVCCHQSDRLRDTAAIEFARHFYRALACQQPLDKAFEMAEAAVLVAPSVEGQQKFLLLPEKPKGDPYHNVQIFYTARRRRSSKLFSLTMSLTKILPPPPRIFLGRELDLYQLLRGLGRARLVKITGSAGIGKSSLAKAACKYVSARISAFCFSEILWLPTIDQSNADELSRLFNKVFEGLKEDQPTSVPDSFDQLYGKIVRILHSRRVLVFLDAREHRSPASLRKISLLLEAIFRGTLHVSVVLICPSGKDIESKRSFIDSRVDLGPLTMKSAATVFGFVCPFVSQRRCPSIQTPNELVELLVPDAHSEATCLTQSMSKRCSDIFTSIGEGVPEKVRTRAATMTTEEYDWLIRLGMKPELQHKVDTRVMLDQELGLLTQRLDAAVDASDFQEAEQLQDALQDLKRLRENFPTLADLRRQEATMCENLDGAVSRQEFSQAGSQQKLLFEVRTKIKKEEEALVRSTLRQTKNTPNNPESTSHEMTDPGSTENPMQMQRHMNQPNKKDFRCLLNETASSTGSDTVSSISTVSASLTDPLRRDGIVSLSVRTKKRAAKDCPLKLTISRDSIKNYCAPGWRSAVVVEVDGARIHRSYGRSLEIEFLKLPILFYENGSPIRCKSGHATLIGPGKFEELKTQYVILIRETSFYSREIKNMQGRAREKRIKERKQLLLAAYRSCLGLLKRERLHAVAFPLLCASSKATYYSKQAISAAIEAVHEFECHKDLKEIRFHCDLPWQAESLVSIATNFGVTKRFVEHAEPEKEKGIHTGYSSMPGSTGWLCKNPLKRKNQKGRSSVKVVNPLLSDPGASGLPNLGNYSYAAKGALSRARPFTLSIVHGSIVDFSYPNKNAAIVCPTTETCCFTAGSEGASVAAAGGDKLLHDVNKIPVVQESSWGPIRCRVGQARIIGPQVYGKVNVQNIILAVGPSYSVLDDKGDLKRKDAMLCAAYRSCLELAKEARLEAVAFSLLSVGDRAGGDITRPLRVAIKTIVDFSFHSELKEIHLCATNEQEAKCLKATIPKMGFRPQTILINAMELGKM